MYFTIISVILIEKLFFLYILLGVINVSSEISVECYLIKCQQVEKCLRSNIKNRSSFWQWDVLPIDINADNPQEMWFASFFLARSPCSADSKDERIYLTIRCHGK